MDRVERWTAPLYILFFVISGAELELSVFTDIAIVAIGLVYIISRSAGKYLGAFGSSKAVKCEKNIVTYLGITLLPQAGVALGMASKAHELGTQGIDKSLIPKIYKEVLQFKNKKKNTNMRRLNNMLLKKPMSQ